jgi:acyl carrier protein
METNEIVLEIVKELSGKEDVMEADSLQFDLGLDSLSMVMLLVLIEEKMKIQLNESDMDPFTLATVADVITMTDRYKGSTNEEDC